MKKALDSSKQNSRLCKISKFFFDWNFRLNRDFITEQNSRLCKILKVHLNWNFRLNGDFITEQNLQLKLALSTALKVGPDFSESCVWGSQV